MNIALPYIWDWLVVSFEISPLMAGVFVFAPAAFADWLSRPKKP